jgi:hypothetical protein
MRRSRSRAFINADISFFDWTRASFNELPFVDVVRHRVPRVEQVRKRFAQSDFSQSSGSQRVYYECICYRWRYPPFLPPFNLIFEIKMFIFWLSKHVTHVAKGFLEARRIMSFWIGNATEISPGPNYTTGITQISNLIIQNRIYTATFF